MNTKERRELLLSILNKSTNPIKGDELANILNVSRQVIVQDIALIRAAGLEDIIATPQGYIIYNNKVATKIIECKNHSNRDEFYNELKTIVDLGGKVKNVIVNHPIYGEIKVELDISSNRDIGEFMKKASSDEFKQLSILTKDSHLHTIEAKNEEILDEIISSLLDKNILANNIKK
ncbi:transcription repressor NadR [Romboutsia ilealis]|uniref:transcription repressor NadR n=1 Tax=Romboutsia ilealis TaxID=1115758 RepID=UPI00257238FE|nr:transcription repressor NadR [Romboutsia ilealis]